MPMTASGTTGQEIKGNYHRAQVFSSSRRENSLRNELYPARLALSHEEARLTVLPELVAGNLEWWFLLLNTGLHFIS